MRISDWSSDVCSSDLEQKRWRLDPRQHLGDTALYTLERRDRIFNRTFSATLLLNLKLPKPIRAGRHCPQLSFCKAEHVSEAARTRELIELRQIERDDRLIRHGSDRTEPRGIEAGSPPCPQQRSVPGRACSSYRGSRKTT